MNRPTSLELPVIQASPADRIGPLIEGHAHVLACDAQYAWLEPEQTTSCGHCASASHCATTESATGLGSLVSRLQQRRFRVAHASTTLRLHPGSRVVIGVPRQRLLNAALLAYGLPLLTALSAASWAQSRWAVDVFSLLAMTLGLAGGLLLVGLFSRHLKRQGELTPQLLRLAEASQASSSAKENP